MGAVIEISIISKDEKLLMKLLSFISLQIKENTTKKTVEVMDNWQYENIEIIESIELAEAFLGNKIVCITEENASGQVGVHIEPIADLLLYNMWFGLEGLSTDAEYAKLIDEFVGYISNDEGIKNIIIGAIGKETIFEYLGDNKTTISKAHNIDVWIIDKKDYLNNILEEYKMLANIYYEDIYKEMLVLSKL